METKGLRNSAQIAILSLWKVRISIGLVAGTRAATLAQCGGAVASRAKTL